MNQFVLEEILVDFEGVVSEVEKKPRKKRSFQTK
jgi:hypothetical protein